MTLQRIIAGFLALTIAGLAGAFYLNWKTTTELRTLKSFVESYVFAEAVAAAKRRRVRRRSTGMPRPMPPSSDCMV
jgi:hypothetical protein